MNTTLLFIRNYLPLLVVPIVFIISIILLNSPIAQTNPLIITGIIYDLTLTAPLLYLLTAWKSKVPKITAVPIFVLGFILATLLIPETHNVHLGYLEMYVLPLVELFVIVLVVTKVRKTVKEVKHNKQFDSDFYTVIKKSASSVLENERVGKVVATEIAMMYYALFTWKKSSPAKNQFTYHKENGVIAVFIAFIFVLITETAVFHILLLKWNAVFAWVLFGISLYTGLQILGHTKAVLRRFSELTEDKLILRYGLFGDAVINYEQIEKVEHFKEELKGKGIHKLALLGPLESHNIKIVLKESISVESVYGINKTCTQILLQIDNIEPFIHSINEKIDKDA